MKNSFSHLAWAALALVPVTLASLLVSPLISMTAMAQTAPTTPAHAPAKAVTHAAATATPLPKNIPVVRGIPKTLYALRYVEIKAGTGAAAMPGWVYSVHYTGWLYDGTKFDSSLDRGTPIQFPQGQRRVIPGWDTGFEGMKVGGKRRLFIPYQLAYGELGRGKIPPKANLIFDVELVDQKETPPRPPMPPMTPKPGPNGATPPPPPGSGPGSGPGTAPGTAPAQPGRATPPTGATTPDHPVVPPSPPPTPPPPTATPKPE